MFWVQLRFDWWQSSYSSYSLFRSSSLALGIWGGWSLDGCWCSLNLNSHQRPVMGQHLSLCFCTSNVVELEDSLVAECLRSSLSALGIAKKYSSTEAYVTLHSNSSDCPCPLCRKWCWNEISGPFR